MVYSLNKVFMLKQTIVLSSHINESEKLKSLALLNKKTINTHYYNALELARYLLQLSGIVIEQKFISDEEMAAKAYKRIKEIDYFKACSFKDIYDLILSINDLRRYIVDNEENEINGKLPMDAFSEKNSAIKDAYKLMISIFENENLIDEIGIIRLALKETSTFSSIEFINYNDQYPLHKALINRAAGKIVDPVPNNLANKTLTIVSYTKAFGQTNEVENILNYIYQNKIPFDQCLVAAAETKDYANIFSNYKDLLSIPIVIGTGTIILETKPGKLFSIVNDWIDNFYNTDYLKRVIYDESFDLDAFKTALDIPDDDFKQINKSLVFPETISLDSIISTVGDMKMSFDQGSNNEKLDNYRSLLSKYINEGFNKDNTNRRSLELPFVEKVVNELNNGLLAFLDKYAFVVGAKDENAKGKILKYLNYHFAYDVSYEDIKKAIFLQNVGRESVKEGALYFTSIENAISCLRPYLFIVGLSSNNFPGVSKENPILLDEDYEAFDVPRASIRSINDNKETFFKLLDEANDNDVSIHLSYAYYNSQSLKEQNSSSVIFESYKYENGDEKTIEDLNDEFKNKENNKFHVVEFFDNDVLPVAQIGRDIADNKHLSFDGVEPSQDSGPIDLTKIIKKPHGYSASSVTNYAHCPYLFYLSEILRMEQPEEIDIYEIIPANELGTLAHYLLETLDKSKVKTKEEFGAIAGQRFNEYLIIRYPNNFVTANLAKDKFVEMMENAYEMEGNTKTLFREEDIVTVHESGIKIHGFPDKVIENPDGTVRVIDYKTGNAIKHSSDDAASMVQCTMYSYIIERIKGRRVSDFEYWYLRHKHIVRGSDGGKTMQDHYDSLKEILTNLTESFHSGEFLPNLDYCKSCFYREICMKGKK